MNIFGKVLNHLLNNSDLWRKIMKEKFQSFQSLICCQCKQILLHTLNENRSNVGAYQIIYSLFSVTCFRSYRHISNKISVRLVYPNLSELAKAKRIKLHCNFYVWNIAKRLLCTMLCCCGVFYMKCWTDRIHAQLILEICIYNIYI